MLKCVFCALEEKNELGFRPILDSKLLVVRDHTLLSSVWTHFPYVYRINDGYTQLSSKPALLQQVCKERRWIEFSELHSGFLSEFSLKGTQCWNLWWKNAPMNPNSLIHLQPWQMTNHIPKASNFCRKDVLTRYLRRLKATYKVYDFSPMSFNLPTEFPRLSAEHRNRVKEIETIMRENTPTTLTLAYKQTRMWQRNPIWIAKPVGKSQGKGIFLFDHVTDLSYDEPYVVQEYIYRPLLINGHKWDLRLYVCITCTNPLTIYAYREGITRFATQKYQLDDFNSYSHLTNTSLNKASPTYNKNKETIGYGSKWSLKQLRVYLRKMGIDDYLLWQRIWGILVLTIIGDGKDISQLEWSSSNFEFLGYDVLVDEKLKPHLLEVNVNPSLGSDNYSVVDAEVKKPMLHEMFTLLGLPDGRDFPQVEFHNGCNSPITYDEPTFLDKILDPCREVENLSIYGLNKLINSITSTKPEPPSSAKRSLTRPPTPVKRVVAPVPFLPEDPNNNEFLPWKLPLENLADKSISTSVSRKKKNKAIKKETFKPVAVRVPVIKGPKDKTRINFPSNGPGMNLLKRSCDSEASCGNWVRIFPFDAYTQEKSFYRENDDTKAAINNVANYLKHAKEIVKHVNKKSSMPHQSPDSVYDTIIKETWPLDTDVWHPNF